jgi:hypothetical protein
MIHMSDRRRIELALPASMMARIVRQLAGHPETDRATIAAIGRDCDLAQLAPFQDMAAARQRDLHRRLWRARSAALDWMENRSIATAYVAVVRWIQAVTEAGILVPAEDAPFLAACEALLQAVQERPENVELLGQVDRSATRAAGFIHLVLRSRGFYVDHPSPFERRKAA